MNTLNVQKSQVLYDLRLGAREHKRIADLKVELSDLKQVVLANEPSRGEYGLRQPRVEGWCAAPYSTRWGEYTRRLLCRPEQAAFVRLAPEAAFVRLAPEAAFGRLFGSGSQPHKPRWARLELTSRP